MKKKLYRGVKKHLSRGVKKQIHMWESEKKREGSEKIERECRVYFCW